MSSTPPGLLEACLLMEGRKKQLHFPLLGWGSGYCQLNLPQRDPLYRSSLISNSSFLLDSQVALGFQSRVTGFVLITEEYSLHGPLGLSWKLQNVAFCRNLPRAPRWLSR